MAGHETTAVATTWCLFGLTQALGVQEKLRQELWTIDTETPSMDELSALPYLDMVVRESLRVYSPLSFTFREAVEDDAIPVGEPYRDRHGRLQDHIQ